MEGGGGGAHDPHCVLRDRLHIKEEVEPDEDQLASGQQESVTLQPGPGPRAASDQNKVCMGEWQSEIKLEPLPDESDDCDQPHHENYPTTSSHEVAGAAAATPRSAVGQHSRQASSPRDRDAADAHAHAQARRFACAGCGNTYRQKRSLRRHKQSCSHNNPKNITELKNKQERARSKNTYNCEVCKKEFGNSSNLKDHLRMHTGEKPYSCDVCQKSFSQSSHLRSHRRLHTGDKPFACLICQKRFAASGGLRKHQRTHTGDKHTCDICNKQLSDLRQLKIHKRVRHKQTADKPYSCEVCKKEFAELSYLKKPAKCESGSRTKGSVAANI